MPEITVNGRNYWLLMALGVALAGALLIISVEINELRENNVELISLVNKSIQTLEYQDQVHQKEIGYMKLLCEYKLLEKEVQH